MMMRPAAASASASASAFVASSLLARRWTTTTTTTTMTRIQLFRLTRPTSRTLTTKTRAQNPSTSRQWLPGSSSSSLLQVHRFSSSSRSSSSSRIASNDARSLLLVLNNFTARWENVRRRLRDYFTRPFWRRLAIAVRYTRIPILIFSVYSLGYQQGIVDCTKTPLALQAQILQSILASMGIKSALDENNQPTVQVIQESTLFSPRALMQGGDHAAQIARVGHKIVCAARATVQSELDGALKEVHEALPPDLSAEQARTVVQNHPRVQFWYAAKERIMGEELSNQPWQYVLVSSPAPNAFVTEVLPRRFFLTTSLLKVATTPDELAVVLGHELSHLILGHVSETNRVESLLRSLEILLLSIDPTSGFLALLVIGGLAAARRIVSARHSREHESEADDLGLQLAARACYDTAKGSHVMRKMNELKVAVEPNINSATSRTSRAAQFGQELLDTHPPSLERFERMQQRALEENFHKYRECKGVGVAASKMWGKVGPAPAHTQEVASQGQRT